MFRNNAIAEKPVTKLKALWSGLHYILALMDFEPIPNLYLGTSSWSTASWVRPSYPLRPDICLDFKNPSNKNVNVICLRLQFGITQRVMFLPLPCVDASALKYKPHIIHL